MMSASGGKIVLHPQNTNNLSGIVNGATVGKGGINSGNLATGEPILSLRTIQGIRVLPVSSSNVTVLNGTGGAVSAASIGSSQPNVVARIVATNAGTINNNKMPATTTRQVVLPISNTNPNNNMVPLHVTPSDTLNQVAARSNSPVAVPINPNVLAESNQLQGK